MRRAEEPDLVYRTEGEKWNAIVEDIIARQNEGRPALVGTVSIEVRAVGKHAQEARRQARRAEREYHAQEAEIVAQAGAPA